MIFALFAQSALACPFCATETGRQVREALFGSDFDVNLLRVMAPVPVLLLVILGLLLVLPRGPR